MTTCVDIAWLRLAVPDRGMPEISAAAGARASRVNGMDESVASAVLLPTSGMGFFGWPAIAGHCNGGDFIVEFSGWKVEPAAGKIHLRATDTVAKLDIGIAIAAADEELITMQVKLSNTGDKPYTLDRCMAASLLAYEGPAQITSLGGSWGKEFHIRHEPLGTGLWLTESRRGRTSHDRFPGVFLTTERETVGLHLGWSGNYLLAIDTLDDGRRLIHCGELFEPGEVVLAPGEAYESPTAYLARGENLADVSQHFTTYAAKVLARQTDRRPRPVTLNTWEGNYFDHRLDHLKAQADAAAKLGIERFVLDDGWFGRRDDDTTSLGDWLVDARKYPNGLGPLVDHVTGLGMEFGLWFEPEMVNPASDLYRAHPDWVLQAKGRPLLLSRHQLVLDVARPEVSEYLFARLDAVLRQHAISYIKWDMNRDLTHVGGADGRARTGRQTRAVYALMQRVRDAHPAIEIESCASGGGRADFGVLAYTQRIWTSDCTDALERLEIQRGASLFFPPQVMGAHVSASPNHQTRRQLNLGFRALVALAYHFGVELNPLTLNDAERVELAEWIAVHKRIRPLLHGAGALVQRGPEDGRSFWGKCTGNRAVFIVAQGPQMTREQAPPLRLPVTAEGLWRIAAMTPAQPDFIRATDGQRAVLAGETAVPAETLRGPGLNLPMLRPESGMVLELERIQDC